jgi:hypothetical protein
MPVSAVTTTFNFDTSDEETYEDICEDEEVNSTEECCDGGMYIGIPVYDAQYDINLLASRVSPKTFFDYDMSEIMDYLVDSNVVQTTSVPCSPEIMQVHIDNFNAYHVIMKTHWLKLVQRKWKSVLLERKRMMRDFKFIRRRELRPNVSRKIPGLRGMMSNLLVEGK